MALVVQSKCGKMDVNIFFSVLFIVLKEMKSLFSVFDILLVSIYTVWFRLHQNMMSSVLL